VAEGQEDLFSASAHPLAIALRTPPARTNGHAREGLANQQGFESGAIAKKAH